MAGSVNKVILVGRVGADPESRSLQNGDSVVSFRMATSETWRDKQSGERKEKTEWHSVVIWNEALGKIADQYVRKGSLVYVEGQLQTRKWEDRDGNERYTTEVVLNRFRGELGLLGDGGRGGGDDDGGSRSRGSQDRGGRSGGGGGRREDRDGYDYDRRKSQSSQRDAFDDDLDDEIPF